jgi:hypothetical protein
MVSDAAEHEPHAAGRQPNSMERNHLRAVPRLDLLPLAYLMLTRPEAVFE